MPRFIDHHDQFPMPPADQLGALRAMVTAPAGADGVQGVNIMFATDGSADCVTDAPSAAAVVQAHEAAGMPVQASTIREITSLV